MPACSAQISHSYLKVMGIFRTLGSGSFSVAAIFRVFKANTSIHGLGEDDTATFLFPLPARQNPRTIISLRLMTKSLFTSANCNLSPHIITLHCIVHLHFIIRSLLFFFFFFFFCINIFLFCNRNKYKNVIQGFSCYMATDDR